MPTKVLEGSARDRLLAAADELFYEEGVHTVGIDRVIARAGVAKASLYSAFGSKDGLIRAYLAGRDEAHQRRIADRLARHDAPRDRLLAMFDLLGEVLAEPGFRGCPFLRASAEGPAREIPAVCNDVRARLRATFTDLARGAGAVDPEALARQLVLLYDGASVAAQMDRDPAAAIAARDAAAAMLDAATRPRSRARRGAKQDRSAR